MIVKNAIQQLQEKGVDIQFIKDEKYSTIFKVVINGEVALSSVKPKAEGFILGFAKANGID